MFSSQLYKLPPGVDGVTPAPDPAAPLVSAWRVRVDAGEPQAVVRVRNLQSTMAAGRDAWGRAATKPQPVLLSCEVSFAQAFDAASRDDALVDAETVHYGTLSKTLLGSVALFSASDNKKEAKRGGNAQGENNDSNDDENKTPRTADVLELLWVQMTGRVVDGSYVALPPDQLPFLDAARLRSLALTLRLPKASLLGDGVSLTTSACFADLSDVGADPSTAKRNPLSSYARTLRLHGLRVPTLVGVNSNERTAKQMLVVDVEIDHFDLQEDIHTELEKDVVEALDSSSFETLEALGTHIANRILNDFRIGDDQRPMRERGWQVRVCLEKPIAVPFAECPSVEVRLG